MTETGFVKAQSDNLPKIDAFMMTSYFATNPDFTSSEIKGVKAARSERESYGDSAVGYVQLKREGGICVVKGRITPEHNVRQKCYSVTATCDEGKNIVISVQCEDCAAHLGGCKHAIAFLAWLHRRSEDPPSTSVECYWKKSKLSTIGTSLKFIKAKDFGNQSKIKPVPKCQSFLSAVINKSKIVGHMDNQLMKYYKDQSEVEKLSVHYLFNTMPKNLTSANEFIEYCKQTMNKLACEQAYKESIEQSDCPLWHELRYARITASKAYDAAHCKVLDGTLTESILGATKLRDTEAMKRGRLLEMEVIKVVEKKIKIRINKCGLKLNPNYPVMGASPDGESADYIMEIKCPSSEKALARYITKENKVAAKYMAPVQLQMQFCNKNKAIFCVAHSDFETSREVTIVEVYFDEQYCQHVLEKCLLFWCKAIYPILYKNKQ